MHAWEQIQQTIEYIEAHLDEDFEIDSLAKRAGLSPFYFQRLFSRLVKKPVAEYVRLRRMAKAADRLRQGDYRILDIALEVGFSSHEHFTRTFKDTFGFTPEEYRKKPQPLNHMTKPELLLQYTLVDEQVPLLSEGIVLEMRRQRLDAPIDFIGAKRDLPVAHMAGLGTESGIDPLGELWNLLHQHKQDALGLCENGEEIGVAYPCPQEGYFSYFAGGRSQAQQVPQGFMRWSLPAGEYIVCSFEAPSFEQLVMDALYKAQQYTYNVWLPQHQLKTRPFCAERYASHDAQTTAMELWLKLED